MCARYTLTPEQVRLVIAGLVHVFAFAPRYNIGPAQRVPVIAETGEGIKAVEMRWGITPVWSKSLLINAQSEHVTEKPTFKPLLGQRCLVPMDGFYEWKSDKTPVRFVLPTREVFCVAALWKETEELGTPPQASERRFVVLTRAANPSVSPIHNRMPFIVRGDDYGRWLSEGINDGASELADDAPLEWYPVSREVNNVRKEHADLIRPVPVERELF